MPKKPPLRRELQETDRIHLHEPDWQHYFKVLALQLFLCVGLAGFSYGGIVGVVAVSEHEEDSDGSGTVIGIVVLVVWNMILLASFCVVTSTMTDGFAVALMQDDVGMYDPEIGHASPCGIASRVERLRDYQRAVRIVLVAKCKRGAGRGSTVSPWGRKPRRRTATFEERRVFPVQSLAVLNPNVRVCDFCCAPPTRIVLRGGNVAFEDETTRKAFSEACGALYHDCRRRARHVSLSVEVSFPEAPDLARNSMADEVTTCCCFPACCQSRPFRSVTRCTGFACLMYPFLGCIRGRRRQMEIWTVVTAQTRSSGSRDLDDENEAERQSAGMTAADAAGFGHYDIETGLPLDEQR